MATITVGQDDDMPTILRELLDLAGDPTRDVNVVAGTRDVRVPDELADRWLDMRAATPDQTPAAPRKRAPRKSTAKAEE